MAVLKKVISFVYFNNASDYEKLFFYFGFDWSQKRDNGRIAGISFFCFETEKKKKKHIGKARIQYLNRIHEETYLIFDDCINFFRRYLFTRSSTTVFGIAFRVVTSFCASNFVRGWNTCLRIVSLHSMDLEFLSIRLLVLMLYRFTLVMRSSVSRLHGKCYNGASGCPERN